MFLAIGIALLLVSLVIIAAIIFTTARSVKESGELVISKKSLLYLVPTFVLVFFLHVAGSVYNGDSLDFFGCFALVGSAFEVITKFSVDTSVVLPICRAYPIFYVDFVLAYLTSGTTVILSVASLFSPRIRNYFSCRKLLRRGCDIVIGDCPDSERYLRTNKGSMMFASDITRERYAELIKNGFTVIKCTSEQLNKNLGNGEYNFILFGGTGISYTSALEGFIAVKNARHSVTLSLEANLNEVKVIKDALIAAANGKVNAYINCFSKHELIARKFVTEHPITKYIPEHFYNANRTLKTGKSINVVFVGFGKMNYQLFRMCATQFHFASVKDGILCAEQVNYHVFDSDDSALHNEFFSRLTYETDEEFKDCDFPAPERICRLSVNRSDINSVEARRYFKELVSGDSFSYFIVSLNDDLGDASYAQTLVRLFRGEENYRIFVRSRENSEKLFGSDKIIYFGGVESMYTHDNIVNDDLSELARRLNVLYNCIDNAPEWLKAVRKLPAAEREAAFERDLTDRSNREFVREQWEARPLIEQASNLYHALNLPFKLNLLGFGMVKKESDSDSGAPEEEFKKVYVNSGRETGYSDIDFYFGTESSNVLAFIEHSRWNALYILYDYRQMKKKDMRPVIKKDAEGAESVSVPHKNTELKQHACLTTYYGIKELIEYKFSLLYPGTPLEGVSRDDPRLIELYSLYRYDYMDLDRIYEEISALGYKLVKRG